MPHPSTPLPSTSDPSIRPSTRSALDASESLLNALISERAALIALIDRIESSDWNQLGPLLNKAEKRLAGSRDMKLAGRLGISIELGKGSGREGSAPNKRKRGSDGLEQKEMIPGLCEACGATESTSWRRNNTSEGQKIYCLHCSLNRARASKTKGGENGSSVSGDSASASSSSKARQRKSQGQPSKPKAEDETSGKVRWLLPEWTGEWEEWKELETLCDVASWFIGENETDDMDVDPITL